MHIFIITIISLYIFICYTSAYFLLTFAGIFADRDRLNEVLSVIYLVLAPISLPIIILVNIFMIVFNI